MDFVYPEGFVTRNRQSTRCQLVTQQFRLRHVVKITGLNFSSQDRYYYTLHATAMSAPFYTSAEACGPNPKWPELDHRTLSNQGATAIVLRIWSNSLIQTWGIYFSGLVHLGNKTSDIQPSRFKTLALYFSTTTGSFFTPIQCLNDTSGNVEDKPTSVISVPKSEIRSSYSLEKLRKLQHIQLSLRNRYQEVELIREKILHFDERSDNDEKNLRQSEGDNVRYAPRLLTMKSVTRMLEEKPTRLQRKEIERLRKQIEDEQFKNRLLSSERDRMRVQIRKQGTRLKNLVDLNEETGSALMDQYYKLSRDTDRLKEVRGNFSKDCDYVTGLHQQLARRRRQVLKELLFLYPITQEAAKKWTIHGVELPDSDVLADHSDVGLGVALGYVTHVILLTANFLQLPLRYPMTHFGSRSHVTDHVSISLADRDRSFPLFTRGKERIHFTYGVYLLNKNIAHLRCLCHSNTPDLKATLSNLHSLLDTHEMATLLPTWLSLVPTLPETSSSDLTRYPRIYERTRRQETCANATNRPLGLSDILAIPEAYLSRQISQETFVNYARTNGDQDLVIEQGTDLLDPDLDLDKMSETDCKDQSEERSDSAPLTLRTDALLNTDSFNLVRPKSSL